MIIPLEQIDKAEKRARGTGIEDLVRETRDLPPSDMSTKEVRDDRYRLLAQTFGDNAETRRTFERIIAGNELQPINYLSHGLVAARPVCRLTLTNPRGYATGFLIAPQVLITNNHVYPNAAAAKRGFAEFDLELDVFDKPKIPIRFDFDPDRLFITSAALDYTVVAVKPLSDTGITLDRYGFLPMIGEPGKVVEGEWLTIIQHPAGEAKQVCIRENKFVKRTADCLWYTTDTLAGSSGALVANNSWQVVALHHSGVPEKADDRIQTLDGRDYDPGRDPETAIKWVANEGIRVSRIVDDLRERLPDEILFEPVFNMTAPRAQAVLEQFAGAMIKKTPSPQPIETDPVRSSKSMSARTVRIAVDIDENGHVSVRQDEQATKESFRFEAATDRAEPKEPPPEYEVQFDFDYCTRQGYNTEFLGKGFSVPLPQLGSLEADVTRFVHNPNEYILKYHGYSAVMHKTRKFAIYTAASIDGGNRFNLRRPHDEWRFDPRIPRSAQIGGNYYASNQFDRGHLTRYEDMEYGTSPLNAVAFAADSLHFTNCVAQHAKFNRGKQLWQGLEQHILERAIKSDKFAAQVFTGPVLDQFDPVWEKYKDVQYPLQFWKIAVCRFGSGLFAAAFLLDQSDVISKYGIEAAVDEVPFSAFKTYQVPIAEVERLTGLTFAGSKAGTFLRDVDPLKNRVSRQQRRPTRFNESSVDVAPPGYVPLETGSDIVV
ncbi:DNA/RNA non-specific endonuclease [Rhizobium leguminosarum]|uniref:DNA/RNA non-specific endonuclease n=1 Tax=Rhizobium leguminosarum TaxID=384 RepID=UPI00144118ED|nr:DNA/RNA non-specific endonuclease [Rhizobium leguminosarum]NKK77696.1 hypothetical protein [Rhizobium leguminosarum bv. viciae]